MDCLNGHPVKNISIVSFLFIQIQVPVCVCVFSNTPRVCRDRHIAHGVEAEEQWKQNKKIINPKVVEVEVEIRMAKKLANTVLIEATMGQLCLNGDSIVSNSITNSPYGPQWQHSVSLCIMYRRTLLGSLLYTFSHLYYNREYDMTIHHRQCTLDLWSRSISSNQKTQQHEVFSGTARSKATPAITISQVRGLTLFIRPL